MAPVIAPQRPRSGRTAVSTATLLALSLTSPAFLPAIFTADDKARLLLVGIAVGLRFTSLVAYGAALWVGVGQSGWPTGGTWRSFRRRARWDGPARRSPRL